MNIFDGIFDVLPALLPALATAALATLVLWVANWFLLRRRTDLGLEGRTPGLIVMLVLTVVGLVSVLFALPMETTTRGHLLNLVGLALTAIIALSSTTFVANAMAGLMLRMVKSYRPGDFVRVGEQFGRVTERGLLHTEIQTEDRDLTTLPNLYLISNPITVIRASGTIVSARLSLGYDVAHTIVEPLLIRAAEAAELSEPFVQIVDLGDFSVSYRVAGFLADTKHLLATRSRLRQMVLDTLHEEGIEIVSPAFMNQRVLPPGTRMLPGRATHPKHASSDGVEAAEPLIFDKAEEAEKIEDLRTQYKDLLGEIKDLQTRLGDVGAEERTRLERAIERKRRQAETIQAAVDRTEQERANEQ